MRNLSVLIVHNKYLVQGGEEKIIENQTGALRSAGVAVDFYELDSAEYLAGSRFSRTIKALQMPFSIEQFFRLRNKIKTFKPSVVHVHNVFPLLTPAVYFAVKSTGIPLVQSVHNYRFLCANGLFLLPNGNRCERCKTGAHWNAFFYRCYNGSRLRSAGMAMTLMVHSVLKTFKNYVDAYIAPSNFLKMKLVESGFPENKIHQFPAGIPPMEERSHHPQSHRLLFVGRLSREKGLITLLEAASKLPGWEFIIAGEGPMKIQMNAMIDRLGLKNISMLGKLNKQQVALQIQKATALVLPSECYENLPTVILEAWYYGTPVIVSRLGGMAELVKEGVNGVSFAAGDSEDLARAITDLEKLRGDDMGKKIRENFLENYSLEKNLNNLLAVYTQVSDASH